MPYTLTFAVIFGSNVALQLCQMGGNASAHCDVKDKREMDKRVASLLPEKNAIVLVQNL